MNAAQIKQSLHTLLEIQQPVFIWGPPGVGKSQVVAQIAAAKKMELCDVRAVLLDPIDLRGLPRITPEGTAIWCPPGFLPNVNNAPKGILFLDELNSAPPLVQAACYQLILDRRIGEYKLPNGWTVVAAGNREQDKAVTHRMPSALANRLVHLEFEADLEDWLVWALQNEIRQEIIAFLRFRPKLLHDFAPLSPEKAFPSPRSWEFLSNILQNTPHVSVEYELIKGTIGSGAAAEFSGFLQVWRELPTIETILDNPEHAPVPHEPAAIYAICEALSCQASPEVMPALTAYAERLPTEFSILLMRDAVCKDKRIVETEAFSRWAETNAQVLM